MRRRALGVLAIALAACGGAPPPPVVETRAEPAPPPPRSAPAIHVVSLAASLPAATRTSAGLGPDGTLYCRQTYFASPAEDERHCMADGHGITARVLHAIDPAGAAQVWLETPLEIRRIGDCGNDERVVRRPPAALRTRSAPTLASARPADEVDIRSVQFASCPDADLALRFADGVSLEARGAVLRVVSPGVPTQVELLRGDELVRRWDVPAGTGVAEQGMGLELEVLCNESFVVVSGGVVLGGRDTATTREDALACVPAATPRAAAWRSFERLRFDRRDGTSTPIEIEAPPLDTRLR